MFRILISSCILPYCLILLSSSFSSARGAFITTLTPSVTPGIGGLTHYQYTLTNQAGSSLPAVEFGLSIAPAANLTSLIGPTGWDITYTLGDTIVDWASPSSTTDIQAGHIAVFSFDSPLRSISQNYLIIGFDDATFTLETNQGMIASPGASVVPEPTSLVLLSLGVLGVLAYVLRRRRAAAV